MFQYFDKENINGQEVIDIWKNISVEIDTEDFFIHTLIDGDNLMGLSYRYYNTIDDWWVIYLFNNLTNINFDLIQTDVVEASVEAYKNDIENFENLPDLDKAQIKETLRSYYQESLTLAESIERTNEFTENGLSEEDLYDFIVFIEQLIITNSFYNVELKIPNSNVVQIIKNRLEDLSDIWNK